MCKIKQLTRWCLFSICFLSLDKYISLSECVHFISVHSDEHKPESNIPIGNELKYGIKWMGLVVFFSLNWNLWVFHRQQLKYCVTITTSFGRSIYNKIQCGGKYSMYIENLSGLHQVWCSVFFLCYAHNKQIMINNTQKKTCKPNYFE